MPIDKETYSHKIWLGLLQPVGLVVSPLALVHHAIFPNQNIVPLQQKLIQLTQRNLVDEAYIRDFPQFLYEILGWQKNDIVGDPETESALEPLELVLPEYRETLKPTYAVPKLKNSKEWLMLIQIIPAGLSLDALPSENEKSNWEASPQSKFERLLREKEIPMGLLCNGTHLRLVYAPRGETSGYLTFPIQSMCEVGGRILLSALHMLLSESRVFNAPKGRTLLELLQESRKYQNEVSTKLSEQVLESLIELLNGFQLANQKADEQLLGSWVREDPQHIYGGLLTTLMRLVFLLYAEDQGLMPSDEIYVQNYSVIGLYEKLREDNNLYHDTLSNRFGAWSTLLSLFRFVFDGGGHHPLHLPARYGQLFNPDEYPFLEGRPKNVGRVQGEPISTPLISDGVLFRILNNLLMLDGERLSYRSLDVEQIGSVYEAMMGFEVKETKGNSIGIGKDHIVVNLDELLQLKPEERDKKLKSEAGSDLSDTQKKALKNAKTPEEVVALLGKRVSSRYNSLLPIGTLYLQPTEERRRSGSHYTPRELTQPVVKNTLDPVIKTLGDNPKPSAILSLKICDPAMGSGAFLVEACRYLAEKLLQAWSFHQEVPEIPPDTEALLYARRLVAQRCLYGVDKNKFAVNLAKLSLWLVTLAKDHAFTFLDHALKHGDSLVGLSISQIASFHWKAESEIKQPLFKLLNHSGIEVQKYRKEIIDLGDTKEALKRQYFRDAEDLLEDPRFIGDLIISAYFHEKKDKDRLDRLNLLAHQVEEWQDGKTDRKELNMIWEELHATHPPLVPFHWEVEFPEVFQLDNPGFDAFVGNPPFLGGSKISTVLGDEYFNWLTSSFEISGGQMDLVAYFFRNAFNKIRNNGTLGLIATKTIYQGDTRNGGLYWICKHKGEIYYARKRIKWVGIAAVVVSVVHIKKGKVDFPIYLDNYNVPKITAFLFDKGDSENPKKIRQNENKIFRGSEIYGPGFLFNNTRKRGVTPSLVEMQNLIEKDPKNQERIFPYIGGEEVNSSPTHSHHRYVINFAEMSEQEARQWPDLMEIVEERVKPERIALKDNPDGMRRKTFWWQWGRPTSELYEAIKNLHRILVLSRVGQYGSFTFLPKGIIYSDSLICFPFDTYSAFSLLQSRIHEVWARFFASSMKDDLRYTPSSCFETFPFPEQWEKNVELEQAGKNYYEFRAHLMQQNNQGLTDTYNRFHNPEERSADILKLRELHEAMDQAVLKAYGWSDIATQCEFLLDYEIDEETENSQKKKPYRYRWPEDIHDEVLARLLALNQKRAEEESLSGLSTKTKKSKTDKKPAKPRSPKKTPEKKAETKDLFNPEKES